MKSKSQPFSLRRVLIATVMAGSLLLTSGPVSAATLFWDADTSTAGNDAALGTNLGGTGVWDTSTSNWWDQSNLVAWPNTAADSAIFSGTFPTLGLPVLNTITVSSGITANQLRFLRSGYTLTGGDITFAGTSPSLHVNLGETATISSTILGSAGLIKTGGGVIRLAPSNNYTGGTTIADGAVIITDQDALGVLDSSPIVVTGFNPAIGSTNLRGFGGGSLVLDGTGGSIEMDRDLSLQGYGPYSDRGGALISTGVNTLSGTVNLGASYSGTGLGTRLIAADGTVNLTSTVSVNTTIPIGTSGTAVSNLGGVNQAGASFYNLTGVLTGNGTLESSGGGTLFLNPSDSSGFSGSIRVSGSAASGQSVVRIDSPNVLGTRTATTTSSVIDMNGGVLAILMDTPSVLAGGAPANVYSRLTTGTNTFFADHTPNSSVKDQTVVFGQLAHEEGGTIAFNSRNGYGMTFSASPVQGGNGASTFNNNLQGGALLTFTGNFWSNTNNEDNRTMTIGGNGNTRITGNIIANAAAFDHNLTKTGTGTLTITSTGSTLDGAVNVNGGTVAINDWRSITNNGSNININGGTLSVIGNNVPQVHLTTSKVINLSGTTGAATILANQTGTSPGVILNSDFTATGAGTKTLTLGGTNTASNTINGAIVQNGTTNVTKIDPGTWVLAGTNTYTGATTISDGTLRVSANGTTSTVIADTSNLVFNATNVFAGGTFEFLGQAGANNVETLGALTPTNGSGTVKLSPGSGGTASLVFASLGTVGGGGSVNITAPTASDTVSFTTISTSNNIANAGLYYNGADFAFVPGAGLAVRAPIYGTDTDFTTSDTALTAARSNQVTGSFSTPGALAIDSLKIDGSHTLTLGGNLTIRTAAGATASGGILQTGGSGTITGAFNVGTNNAAATVIRVNGATDQLTLESTLFGTGGFTKTGEGMLRLAGANAQTGTISINEGTVRLVSGGTLGGAAALTMRQGTFLELNGITPTNSINAFNNNGTIRNTSATTDVTLTVGGANGTGTSNGIIEDGGLAKVNLVKVGTGAQSWLGLSTYTGTTTIGSTGIVSINNLQDGGMPSGIGASSNAAGNLIFNGASTTQAYGGISYTGTTNDETDRLFTLDGGANGGARIQSNGVNGATSSWTNTGAIAFGPNATNNPQGIVFGGASTGDNRFFPIIGDNPADMGAETSVYKVDAGVWYLEATNTYTGPTTIRGGALYVTTGTSLPTASNLVLDGGSLARTGAFTRTLGTGSNQVQWTAHGAGGFSAGGSPLTVDWGNGAVWGSTPGFLGTGALLLNNSGVAKSDVDVLSSFEITQGIASTGVLSATTTAGSATVNLTAGTTAGLAIGQEITGNPNIPAGRTIATIVSATQFTLSSGTGVTAATGVGTDVIAGGYRQINVGDFTSIGADFGTISGDISGAGTLAKEGAGILNLRGDNTYTGQTLVRAGTLVVETLGNSSTGTTSSVGASGVAMGDGNAIALGNGGTGAAILEYVGAGETSDRKIRLNSTTGSNQIHGDGVGSLILTNVANDMTAGAKLLILRGVSASNNMITSVLADNGGALGITVDGSTAWTLTGDNSGMSGVVSTNAGALGVGHNNALGTGSISFNNGNFFAYGGDRTLANPIDQDNSATMGFLGDYSISFTQALQYTGTTGSFGTNNNVAAGKALTFGGVTANAITGNRTWTIDGSGTTIIDGSITTTQTAARGLVLLKTGDGVVQLNGTASNFNRNAQNIDIDRGTLRLGAAGVIPDGLDDQTTPVAYGGVNLTPELVGGDTAIFDLNGFNETINGLTANTDGTAIIDNTSATAATLTFGAANAAVSFGGGIGTYTVQNSGGGALSLTKTGSAAALIPTGVTLDYTGATSVNGGSFTIASPLNGTTALSATNATTLALTGGITNPGLITSIEVGGGSTLSLLDGAGSLISNLTSLSLGNTGTGTATLNLNIGDGATDTLTLTGGALNLGNTITFNMTDAGMSELTTYTLLNVLGGGLLSSLTIPDFIQGATPGGFTAPTWTVTDNVVQLTTGTLIIGDVYWRGLTDNTWNANANNWSTDKAGTTPAGSIPGAGNKVIFAYDGVGTGAVVTTLEQNFKVNSLVFESGATTPASVTINPGTVSTNRIEIAPSSSSGGIAISAGGPAVVTISSPVRLGGSAASQTWNVADAGSVLSIGSLLGERDVTKTGLGKVVLTAAADPTFNSGSPLSMPPVAPSADFTIDAGTLEIRDVSALGNPINSNLATVTVNSTGAFFYNGAASTATNLAMPITLNGGTLSAGNAPAPTTTITQNYSGPVNVSGNSFINMADSNGPATNTAQNITLSGVVSGSGSLTIDSNNSPQSASNFNQIGGTLTINNAGSSWNGDLTINRGTVTIGSAASATVLPDDVTFDGFGRLILQGVDGQTINRSGALNYAAGAYGEFQVDNVTGTQTLGFLVNQNGAVTLGSGGTGANVRVALVDNLANLDIAGDITLGGSSSISVSNAATRLLTISGDIGDGGSGYGLVINDDAGGWAQTNGIVRMTGANTFTGNVSLDSGILEYTTVTNAGGGASSLGNGSAINVTNSSTLRFIGTSAQSTNRPINVSAGVLTLSANGATAADTITYAGAITIPATTADGSQVILTGSAGRVGIISGGISQTISGTNNTSDLTVNGGTWTHTGTTVVPDDMTVTGADTILNLDGGVWGTRDDLTVTAGANLNINAAGALSFNTFSLSADASLRATNGGTITIGANNAVVVTQFDGLRIGVDAGGLGTLVMDANQSVAEFILGNRTLDREGLVNGTGTLTVTGNLDLYEGTINANLASTGSTVFEKFGTETVTLKGDNSGLASTGATVVYGGTLALDYTSSNATKLRAASALDLRGGTLQIIGNASAATSQSVGSLTLANNGASTISVTPGAGQEAVINLNAITRGNVASDGTIRFILPTGTQTATNGVRTTSPNSTFGLLGTGAASTADAAYATVEDGTGTWFATNSGGNVVALISTVKDDVTAWMNGEHITDSTGFTGMLECANINSLRFDAAAGSDLVIGSGVDLNIGSGGILVTGNVGGTPSIMGGDLVSGVNEIVVTQDSLQTFQIGSNIGGAQAVTKSGAGTLLLTGNNSYTGATEIQFGTLQVGGGNAIGDNSPVNLAIYEDSTLQLLASETIGRLGGGQRQGDDEHGLVDVDSHTLTINNSGANTTYAGFFTGTGAIEKRGTHDLTLSNVSTGFTGVVTVDSGMLMLTNTGQINASVIRINKGGALMLDNNGTTRSGTRILDTTTVTLNSADGTFQGSSIIRGLAIRTNQNANTSETIGTLNFASGANYLSGEGDVATGTASSFIIADEFVRLNNATLAARGRSLGAASGERNQFKIGTSANETAFIGALVGGAGAAGSKNISIIPWAIAASNADANGALAATDMGNSLATYVAGTGIRPLDLAGEYSPFGLGAATDNVRESLASDLGGLTSTTMNALVIHNDNTAASTINVTGTGTGSQTLTNTSGAFLFTLNTGATASSAHSTILGGFDGGIATPSGEYIFHVVNPSSASNTATQTVTVASDLTSSADITKSGRGRLIFTPVTTNTAGGGANKTTINEGELEIADLDNIGGNTGGLVFAGGTLRLASSYTGDDFSSRTISILAGGGTLDTNGVNVTINNGIGTGAGQFTKTGLGTLTLAGTTASSHTGLLLVSQGTLELAQTGGTAIGTGGLSIVSAVNPTTVLLSQSNQIADGASVNVESTGSNGAVFNLAGNSETIGALTVTGTTTNGAMVQTGSGGVLTVTGDITLNNNRNSPGNTGREVLITGTGTHGTAAPDSGTLNLGGVARTITVNRTGTNASMDGTIETIITNGGIVKEGSQTLILAGTNTYAGDTVINEGAVRISSADNLGADVAGNDLALRNGATLQSTGTSVILGSNRSVSLDGTGGTLDVTGGATNALIVQGVISGHDCAPLTKTGIGALALTNANTYEGGTNVNAGTLVVANSAGSATGSGQVTVAVGATLTGDGSITAAGGSNITIDGALLVGDPTVLSGTDLALGVTGGGSVILGAGSNTTLDLWSGVGSGMFNSSLTDADRLLVSGTVTLGGTLTVLNSSGSMAWEKFDSWQLFDWTAITGGVTPGTGGNIFSSIVLPSLTSGFVWDTDALYTTGIITVVPEPGRALLILFGLIGLMMRRRR